MFEFIRLSYEEFFIILDNNRWSLSWRIVEPSEVQICEKVLNNNKELVALIAYDITNELCTIAKFEVLQELRNNGLGEKIIEQFIDSICYDIELILLGEDAERFWRKCGFDGDRHLLRFER